MANVKGQRRRYDSTLRQEQARQTRARILDAAQKLFAERGYANTSMEAIARAAGVATDTVYASFQSKPGLLHKLLDVRVGGDEEPVGILERAGPQAVKREPSQRRQLASWIASKGPLRDGMSVDDAAAIVWTVASPEVHRLLRAERGWTVERYRDWLVTTLTRTLLP